MDEGPAALQAPLCTIDIDVVHLTERARLLFKLTPGAAARRSLSYFERVKGPIGAGCSDESGCVRVTRFRPGVWLSKRPCLMRSFRTLAMVLLGSAALVVFRPAALSKLQAKLQLVTSSSWS